MPQAELLDPLMWSIELDLQTARNNFNCKRTYALFGKLRSLLEGGSQDVRSCVRYARTSVPPQCRLSILPGLQSNLQRLSVFLAEVRTKGYFTQPGGWQLRSNCILIIPGVYLPDYEGARYDEYHMQLEEESVLVLQALATLKCLRGNWQRVLLVAGEHDLLHSGNLEELPIAQRERHLRELLYDENNSGGGSLQYCALTIACIFPFRLLPLVHFVKFEGLVGHIQVSQVGGYCNPDVAGLAKWLQSSAEKAPRLAELGYYTHSRQIYDAMHQLRITQIFCGTLEPIGAVPISQNPEQTLSLHPILSRLEPEISTTSGMIIEPEVASDQSITAEIMGPNGPERIEGSLICTSLYPEWRAIELKPPQLHRTSPSAIKTSVLCTDIRLTSGALRLLEAE